MRGISQTSIDKLSMKEVNTPKENDKIIIIERYRGKGNVGKSIMKYTECKVLKEYKHYLLVECIENKRKTTYTKADFFTHDVEFKLIANN